MFNIVHSLSRIKDYKRLNLRFVYIYLSRVISTLSVNLISVAKLKYIPLIV